MSDNAIKRPKRGGKVEDGCEPGSWECTVCTFRNEALAFKCAICDVRKGTSTRKPRLNSVVVDQQVTVQKFVQQQLASSQTKPPSVQKQTMGSSPRLQLKDRPNSTASSSACSRSHSPTRSETPRTPTPSSYASSSGLISPDTMAAKCSNRHVKISMADKVEVHASARLNDRESKSSLRRTLSGGVRAEASTSLRHCHALSVRRQRSVVSNRGHGVPPVGSPVDSNSSVHASNASAPSYRIKNIDKNSARTLAITVNGVTVVFTDYKLKQSRRKRRAASSAVDSTINGQPELEAEEEEKEDDEAQPSCCDDALSRGGANSNSAT